MTNNEEWVELYQKACQERDEAQANYQFILDKCNAYISGINPFDPICYYILNAQVLRSNSIVHLTEKQWDYIVKMASNRMDIGLKLESKT